MDRELLLRARAGELEAFESIVLAKGEPLFRTALAILGSEADARDATQETFISAWRGIGRPLVSAGKSMRPVPMSRSATPHSSILSTDCFIRATVWRISFSSRTTSPA